MKPPQTYSSLEVSEIASVTLRQLQWWDEKKMFRPARVCGNRKWSQSDLQGVRLISKMRSKGLSLRQCRRVIALSPWKHPNCFVVVTSEGARILGGKQVLGYVSEWSGPVWVIEIGDLK